MKKCGFLTLTMAALLIGSTHVYAQNKTGFTEVFEKYAHRKDALSFTFNKTLLDAVDMDFDWKDKVKSVKGDVHQVRFIAFDREDEGDKILKRLDQEIRSLGYPLIPYQPGEVKNAEQFKLYGKKENQYYRQVHLLVRDDEGGVYLISLDGKLKVVNEA